MDNNSPYIVGLHFNNTVATLVSAKELAIADPTIQINTCIMLFSFFDPVCSPLVNYPKIQSGFCVLWILFFLAPVFHPASGKSVLHRKTCINCFSAAPSSFFVQFLEDSKHVPSIKFRQRYYSVLIKQIFRKIFSRIFCGFKTFHFLCYTIQIQWPTQLSIPQRLLHRGRRPESAA